MRLDTDLRLICLITAAGLALFGTVSACETPCDSAPTVRDAAPAEINAFFAGENKTVVTFVGYSGAEYEDRAAMLEQAEKVLDKYEPSATIINIGATPEGIGAVYRLAKGKGFTTTGIVSTQAKQYNAKLASCVDYVFYVEDSTWGGFLDGGDRLSPTSTAMVEISDLMVGIGGGEVARDELTAAQRYGKAIRFIPADMNHTKALEKARKKGLPLPTHFGGAANEVF